MNKKQKEFLGELKALCDKYHIDTIFSSNHYIEIFSNCELLAFRNYVNGEFMGILTSVNMGILTSVNGYEVEVWNTRYTENPSEINENAPNSGENNSSE